MIFLIFSKKQNVSFLEKLKWNLYTFGVCFAFLLSNVFGQVCTSGGDQTTYGVDSWIGYVYDHNGSGTPVTSPFATYRGFVTENETFDRNWGNSSTAKPSCATNASGNNFGVRYRMTKEFAPGTYRFTIGGDDGCRLSIDGGVTWFLSDWSDHGYRTSTIDVPMGGRYNLVLEFYEKGSDARVSFTYSLLSSEIRLVNPNSKITACSGTFYDSGGSASDYSEANSTRTVTFYPESTLEKVRLTFSSFSTENNYDGLLIYNGNSTSASLITSGLAAGSNATTCPAGSWRGTGSPGTITSTAVDGSITVSFKTDGSTPSTGWVAAISCINICALNPGSISADQVICSSSTPANFVGTLPTGGVGAYTYQWEQQANCTGAWSDISGATGINYQAPALTSTACYRRRVINACGTAYSTQTTTAVNLVLNYTFDDHQEPTTNLIPASIAKFSTFTGWSCDEAVAANVSRTLLSNQGYNGRDAVRIQKNAAASGGYFQVSLNAGFPIGFPAGTTFTASVKYKREDAATNFGIGDWVGPDGNNPTWTTISDVAIDNGWRLRVARFTYTNASAGGFTFGINSTTANKWIIFSDFQLEQKNHYTPFTTGSRNPVTITDYSGNGNNGSINQATSPEWTSTGSNEGNYQFDGVATKFIRGSATFPATNWTISLWVKKDAHNPGSYPIFMSMSLPYISCDGAASSFRLSYSAPGQVNTSGTTIPVLGQWYHVVATSDAGGTKLYVNGILEGTNALVSTNTGGTFDLGRHLNTDAYRVNGGVDELKIFQRALTGNEIVALYSSNTLKVTVNTVTTALTGVSAANPILCTGNSTVLTSSGGTVGSNGVVVWKEGGCASIYENNWQTNSFSPYMTTVISDGGLLKLNSLNNDPNLDMTGLGSFDPLIYRYINIRYKVTSGTAGFTEIFFYNNIHAGAIGGDRVAGALISDGAWHILTLDMHSDPDYVSSTFISGWRYGWATASGVTMELDFISLDQYPILAEGTTFTTPSLTESKTYYAERRGDCGSTGCRSVNVMVGSTSSLEITVDPASQTVCEGTDVSMTVSVDDVACKYRLVLKSAYGTSWHGIQEIRGKNEAGVYQTLTGTGASSATYVANPVVEGDYGALNAFDGLYGSALGSTVQWLTPMNNIGATNMNWQNYNTIDPFYSPEWIEWTSPSTLTELDIYNGRYAAGTPQSCFKDFSVLVSYDNGLTWFTLKSGTLSATPGLNTISIEPTYTWKKGVTTVGSGKTLNLLAVTVLNSGDYKVEISDACETITSTNVSTLNVKFIPAVPNVSATPSSICKSETSVLNAFGMAPSVQAADFNATTSVVNLGSPASLQITGDQTIEMWIKPNASALRRNPFAKAYGGEGTITLEPSGELSYYYGTSGTNGGTYQGFGSGSTVPNNQWTHIALVRDLSSATKTLRWYINGFLVNSVTADYAAAVAGSLDALIGDGYTNNFDGSIDNLRIWNVARTAAQISAELYLETPNITTGLVAQYNMNGNITAATGPTGTATAVAFSAPNYFTYTWSGGPSLPAASSSETQTTGAIASAGTKTYTVIAETPDFCSSASSSDVDIVVKELPTASLTTTAAATVCHGNEVTLGGNVTAIGAWTLTLSDGSTSTGSGNGAWSKTVSPSTTTTYSISSLDDGCDATSMTGSKVVTLPAIGTNISGSSNAVCSVKENAWIHFYDGSGLLIGAVNSGGVDLGNVTMAVNVGSSGSMTSCLDPTNPLYTTAYMGRVWKVTSSAYPGTNFPSSATVRLPFDGSELTDMNTTASTITTDNPNDNGASVGNLMLTKFTGASEDFSPTNNCAGGVTRGVALAGSGTVTTTYPLLTGATGASYVEFSVGQFSEMFLNKNFNASPLPVKLIDFKASCAGNEVHLNWSTASEQNSMDFIVERSRDLTNWNEVESVPAAGNSSQNSDYFSTDGEAFQGPTYYRLRQRDLNGEEEIFGPIAATCGNATNSIQVFPNPTHGSFTVEIHSENSESGVGIQLTSMTGQVIETRSINLEAGTNQVNFHNKLESGIYLIRVLDEKASFKTLKLEVRN